jgi:hypothetical protein
MKCRNCLILGLAAISFVACSTTKFAEYRGTDTGQAIQGKGGTVKTVAGIDFWENGDPNRKYKIIGVIDHSAMEVWPLGSSGEKAIARTAKEHGGDAVILAGERRDLNYADSDGTMNFSREKKVFVVKYAD